MPFYQSGTIRYYQFSTLENQGLKHAVFTRQGGYSPAPWKSLNFGASVGDDPKRVGLNRQKALSTLGIDSLNIYDAYQIHSSEIIVTNRPLAVNEPHRKADGIITNQPGLTLMMRFADCVPILLYDPSCHVIGIAHAGWIGTVNKIAMKAVITMKQNFGTHPKDIIAAIGPSIGPDHYVVGDAVIEKVQNSFKEDHEHLLINQNGKIFFDLWKANQVALGESGVCQIEIAGICTNCVIEDWYSHRGEHGDTGRFGAVIGLD